MIVELGESETNDTDMSTKMEPWKKEAGSEGRDGSTTEMECGKFICPHIMAVVRILLHMAAMLQPQGHDRGREGRIPYGSPAGGGKINDLKYTLTRCLRGQRTAANRWYIHFRDAARDFGMEDDVMQPTLLKQGHEMFISIHVDDLLMAGMEDTLCRFLAHLVNRGWELEVKGPFNIGEKFSH